MSNNSLLEVNQYCTGVPMVELVTTAMLSFLGRCSLARKTGQET
jgi:hypothetical protein